MYIIRPPPMSTRLAKDSARTVVASEQASAIGASSFTTMWFMVVHLLPSMLWAPGLHELAALSPLFGT
jgi:hypothetical protein